MTRADKTTLSRAQQTPDSLNTPIGCTAKSDDGNSWPPLGSRPDEPAAVGQRKCFTLDLSKPLPAYFPSLTMAHICMLRTLFVLPALAAGRTWTTTSLLRGAEKEADKRAQSSLPIDRASAPVFRLVCLSVRLCAPDANKCETITNIRVGIPKNVKHSQKSGSGSKKV